MKPRYPNIDHPSANYFLMAPVGELIASNIIEEFILSRWGAPAFNQVKRDEFISWNWWRKELKIVFHFSLGKDYRGLPHIRFTALLCHFSEESTAEVCEYLLHYNAKMMAPTKMALHSRGVVSLKFDSHLALLGPKQLEFRLESFLRQAIEIREELLQEGIGLYPLPAELFEPGETHD